VTTELSFKKFMSSEIANNMFPPGYVPNNEAPIPN
jgi:hypothetical protein